MVCRERDGADSEGNTGICVGGAIDALYDLRVLPPALRKTASRPRG